MPRLHFQTLPARVDAVQLLWKNWSEFCDFVQRGWLNDHPGRYMPADQTPPFTDGEKGPYMEVTVPTMRGQTAVLQHGEWYVRCTDGTCFIMSPELFHLFFEEVPLRG